jgi:hypothetical protein
MLREDCATERQHGQRNGHRAGSTPADDRMLSYGFERWESKRVKCLGRPDVQHRIQRTSRYHMHGKQWWNQQYRADCNTCRMPCSKLHTGLPCRTPPLFYFPGSLVRCLIEPDIEPASFWLRFVTVSTAPNGSFWIRRDARNSCIFTSRFFCDPTHTPSARQPRIHALFVGREP